jgi:transketolase
MGRIDKETILSLKQKATEVRCELLRMIHAAESGHPGGSLSAADIVTALYFHVMNIDPANPKWEDRDRFILSKGHACPVWYTALALRGYFPREELKTLRKFGSILQGHPDMKKVPGIDMTTGSLGQGLSCGVGMALAGNILNKDYQVYVVLGDGELNEGQIWEAAMCAARYKLGNLIAFVDYNKLQLDGPTEVVMPLEPLVDKWRSFNWYVDEIDGHDMNAILCAIEKAKDVPGKPHTIIAHTTKGKGVSFMEDEAGWHGKCPSDDDLACCLKELGGYHSE